MNATTVFAETPSVAAATNVPAMGPGLKKANPDTIEFKQQLENSCEEIAAMMIQIINGSSNISDNSMAIDSAGQKAGIAGTLEGFGLLNYQTDTLTATTENAPPKQQATTADILPKDWAAAAEMGKQTGVTEQFARMLGQKLKSLPQVVQQQIKSEVFKYLGSLESTNNNQMLAAAPQGAAQADKTQNMPDMQSVQDTLAAMLIKLKAVPQAGGVSVGTDAESPVNVLQGALANDAEAAAHTKLQAEAPQDARAAAPAADPNAVQSANAPRETATAVAQDTSVVTETAYANTAQEAKPTVAAKAQPEPVVANDKPDAQPAMASDVQPPSAKVHTEAKPAPVSENQADAPKTDFVKDNVIRIVDKVRTGVSDGKYEFDMDLKPDFLGKVSIRLSMEDGSIRLHIRTDDPGVKGMFTEQMLGLQSMLKEKGLQIASINVTSQSEMNAGGGYEAYRENSNGNNGAHYSAARSRHAQYSDGVAAGIGFYDAAAAPSEYYLGGSAIEYLA